MVKYATFCTPQSYGERPCSHRSCPCAWSNLGTRDPPRAGFEYPQPCPWDSSSSAEAPTVSCSLGKELTLPPFLTVLFNTLLTLKSRHITSQQSTSIRGKAEARRHTEHGAVGPSELRLRYHTQTPFPDSFSSPIWGEADSSVICI